MPLRFLAIGLLATVLAGCGAVSSLGKGAVRGVNRAGESVAGRLTASDKPQVKAELPELAGSIAVEVLA
jgi:hypothetical protein